MISALFKPLKAKEIVLKIYAICDKKNIQSINLLSLFLSFSSCLLLLGFASFLVKS